MCYNIVDLFVQIYENNFNLAIGFIFDVIEVQDHIYIKMIAITGIESLKMVTEMRQDMQLFGHLCT
jgi:hypothetical protein